MRASGLTRSVPCERVRMEGSLEMARAKKADTGLLEAGEAPKDVVDEAQEHAAADTSEAVPAEHSEHSRNAKVFSRKHVAKPKGGFPPEGYVGQELEHVAAGDPWTSLQEALKSRSVLQVPVLGLEGEVGRSSLVVRLPGRVKGVVPPEEIGEVAGGEGRLANLLGQYVAVTVQTIDRQEGVVYLSRGEAREAMARVTRPGLAVGVRSKAIV